MGPKHTNRPYRRAKPQHNPFSDKLLKVMDPRCKPAALRHNEALNRRTKTKASPPALAQRPGPGGNRHQPSERQTLNDQHFSRKLNPQPNGSP